MTAPDPILLQSPTQAARALLEKELAEQLEGIYDIHPDGTIAAEPGEHLSPEECRLRLKIVAGIERLHFAHVGGEGNGSVADTAETAVSVTSHWPEGVAAYVREAAFTALNRFVALKMLEARGLVQECISHGDASSGFKEYLGLAPGARMLPEGGYRLYLESLFDEIGREVGVLFDRREPASLLWPRRAALNELLELLNDEKLSELWRQDDTVGWVFEFFNSDQERRTMRAESQAPRNSRELAVRNQFFTPRYVVELLTDNTLGRLWTEMQGDTPELRQRFPYLTSAGEGPRDEDGTPRVEASADARQAQEKTCSRRGAKAQREENSESSFSASRGYGTTPNLPPSASQGAMQWSPRENFLSNEHSDPRSPGRKRSTKDPRELKILDPACGSGHFLLYAFDLLVDIYLDAWENPVAATNRSLEPLRELYQTRESLQKAIPGLILEHNLHGIDIDPRAAQIAQLALWLRAQRAYQDAGLPRAQRPPIERINVVVAEPMPGTPELRKRFLEQLQPQPLRELVETVFDQMRLAGEAGALLQIEEEIRDAVTQARQRWSDRPRAVQMVLIPDPRQARATQGELFDTSNLTDAAFWNRAESLVYDALAAFARQAGATESWKRRLFARDTARGFAFIDLCRQRYDVVLMNPPFGDGSLPSKPYIDETYGDTRGDVYKAFVECFQSRLVPGGLLGIISSRTGFFLSGSQDWRERIVLRLYRPLLLVDLGAGVLNAMVETAAYVLRSLTEAEERALVTDLRLELRKWIAEEHVGTTKKLTIPAWQRFRGGLKRHQAVKELERLIVAGDLKRLAENTTKKQSETRQRKAARFGFPVRMVAVEEPEKPGPTMLRCVRVIGEEDKPDALRVHLSIGRSTFDADPSDFTMLPGAPFAYWAGDQLLDTFAAKHYLEDEAAAKQGLATADDFRFVRTCWEKASIKSETEQAPGLAKGGGFAPIYFDVHLTLRWSSNGRELKAFAETLPGTSHWSRRIANSSHYFRPGLTWPRRSQKGLSVRAMPAGCIFADKGPAIFVENDDPLHLLALLAVTNSQPFRTLVSLQMAFGSYEVGVLQRTPVPDLDPGATKLLANLAHQAWSLKRSLDTIVETSHAFTLPALLQVEAETLEERATAWAQQVAETEARLEALQGEVDERVARLYGLEEGGRDSEDLSEGVDFDPDSDPDPDPDFDGELDLSMSDRVAGLVSWCVGVAFGRFDPDVASGMRALPPEPDPFAPLPARSPGMMSDDRKARAVLVDDPGHPDHLTTRIAELLGELEPERRNDRQPWIQEAEAHLGTDLRTWLETAFFERHIKRYSKSRRKAPIFWQLCPTGGFLPEAHFSVWLNYHQLTPDTFYRLLKDTVEPKLAHESRSLTALQQTAGATPTASQRREIAEKRAFVDALSHFRAEVARIAPLWKPDLNDGVVINFAPLWRLVPQNRAWQKIVKKTWDELVAGQYDWSHLAMHLWPERVVPKCARDRSLAIAHGLEDDLWMQDEKEKWRPRKRSKAELEALIEARSSTAVKAALEKLQSAPVPQTKSGRRGR